jgi:LysM repeat protein
MAPGYNPGMLRRFVSFVSLWLAVLVVVGCTAETTTPSASNTPPAQLTFYRTRTPRLTTPSPVVLPSPTLLPSITPTPRLHIVAKGDTLLGIAYFYGVSLDDLRAVNPGVDANLLKIGDRLVIPATAQRGAATSADLPTVTPMALVLSGLRCDRIINGGAWCFLVVRNDLESPIESVSAEVRLMDASSGESMALSAYGLLNLVPGKTEFPLAVYFPPPLPADFQMAAELLTALPLAQGDGRYLPVQTAEVATQMDESGLLATVTGKLRLASESSPAGSVWVLAAAYDANRAVVGLRRWELPAGQTLEPGVELPFRLNLYSAMLPIVRVEVWAEARP